MKTLLVLPRYTGALLLILGAALAATAPLAGQAAAQADIVQWEMHELSPGVYASIVSPPAHPSAYASSLVVVQSDHVVVVDTRESPAAARALLADIRRLTDKPVTTVINTHWHGDHVYGNQVFAEAFPGVRIVAHPASLMKLEADGEARLAQDIADQRENQDRWRGWLEAGVTSSGQVLGPDERVHVEEAIARAERKIPELESVTLTLPTDTVRVQEILDSDDREIRIIHPGRAHTDGDLVVYLPEERLLVAGDLIEQGFPYFGDGTVVGSAWALDRLSLLDVDRVLPSHARLQERVGLLSSQRAFLRGVVDAARTDADAAAIAEPFRSVFTEGNEALNERFDSFVADLARRATEESDTLSTIVAACGSEAHRAFDFWIGTWEVTGPGGAVVGHNRIESTHGGCVLRENWTGATGSVGQSFNSYDRARDVWHQTWVDNSGLVLLLDGSARQGGMQLAGETAGPDGSLTQQRITWTVEADDGTLVRQLWESSTDGGTTWSVAFNGLYRKIGY